MANDYQKPPLIQAGDAVRKPTEISENDTFVPSVEGGEDIVSGQDHEAPKDEVSPAAPMPEATTVPLTNVPRPPNGGLKAWLQVFGAFWIYFNTW